MPPVESPINLFLDLHLAQHDLCTVELHVSGIFGTASHPDMQKIRTIWFFYENRQHWQFEVRLLLFIVCACRSQWPRGLRRRSAAVRLMRLWARIPMRGMDICML